MNQKIFNEAVGYIDDELIEEYLSQKEVYGRKKADRNIRKTVKYFFAAACICFAMIFVVPFMVMNLRGFGSEDGEDYKSTHTQAENYNELAGIIGNDTLLSNLDFSSAEYTFEIIHESGNIMVYSSVNVTGSTADGGFDVKIYFPPYSESEPDYCFSGNYREIGSVKVEYDVILNESESYEYAAEFDYDGCKYVVRGYGKDKEEFWNRLSELIGE